MEPELTDELVSQLCMYMRVIDLMKTRQDILDENTEFKQQFDQLCYIVKQIMETLSEAQRDEVLEGHKLQFEKLAKETIQIN